MITRLIEKIKEKDNVPLAIGIDPIFEYIEPEVSKSIKEFPKEPEDYIKLVLEKFSEWVIDAVFDLVPCVKFQSAYYEIFGSVGVIALANSIRYAKSRGLFVILDVKRGDIGSTSAAYASACLGGFKLPSYYNESQMRRAFLADASTVNPYFGTDGILPFIKTCNVEQKCIFVLVATSNPSSFEIQDLKTNGVPIHQKVAELVDKWGKLSESKSGYSNIGAVVGATRPEFVKKLRIIMKNNYFLVPGIGAQGGDLTKISEFFNNDGLGAIITSSRQIIYAFKNQNIEIKSAIRQEAKKMINNLKFHI